MNLRNKPQHSESREPKNHAVETCIPSYLHLPLELKSFSYNLQKLFCPPASVSCVMFLNYKNGKEPFIL